MRKIIHVDMDCFYAAVEIRDRPELAGKPVAVGGPPQSRGVVTTANYEARKFGVRSAMPSSTAARLCPQLIMIPPNFSKYRKASQGLRAILMRYSDVVEPLSLDEAYIDVTESKECGGSATRIAEEIRKSVKEELKLTVSAGVAPNKFLAKIASDINKPDGLKVIRPTEIESFMKTLPIEKIWGVGKVTAEKMHARGIKTCGDLQKFSINELTSQWGSWGARLYDFARGIDDREVSDERERKSLSVEETYAQDILTLEAVLEKLPELYEDWNERMLKADVADRIRGISVKLKHADFKSLTRDRVFENYPKLSDFETLLIEAFNVRGEPVRLIGIGVKLEGAKKSSNRTQLTLF